MMLPRRKIAKLHRRCVCVWLQSGRWHHRARQLCNLLISPPSLSFCVERWRRCASPRWRNAFIINKNTRTALATVVGAATIALLSYFGCLIATIHRRFAPTAVRRGAQSANKLQEHFSSVGNISALSPVWCFLEKWRSSVCAKFAAAFAFWQCTKARKSYFALLGVRRRKDQACFCCSIKRAALVTVSGSANIRNLWWFLIFVWVYNYEWTDLKDN